MAKKIKKLKGLKKKTPRRVSNKNTYVCILNRTFKIPALKLDNFNEPITSIDEESIHEEALRIKNDVKHNIDESIKDKLDSIHMLDVDKLWEEQKPVRKHSERLGKERIFDNKEKEPELKISQKLKNTLLIGLTIVKSGGSLLKLKTTTRIKKYYTKHPEKARENRVKKIRIIRRILALKHKLSNREHAMADSMARLIADIDNKNDEIVDKTATALRISNLKIMIAREYAELNKPKLLKGLFVFIVIGIVISSGINYVSGYEYSYNGRVLGVVKNQEDVLKILDIVTLQLSKEHNAQVEIDKNLDISFERIVSINRTIDDSEEVLKKLTYMQDMKVRAYALYINGNREAIISSKEEGEKILESVKTQYLNTSGTSEYEEIGFAEKVEIKKIETKLGRIQNTEEVIKKILTGAVESRVHVVEAGDTLSGIAKRYSISTSTLVGTNPGISPERLKIGQEIVLTQAVPLITVQTIEVATYIEPIPFETTYQNTDTLFKGEQSIRVRGVNGEAKVVARIIKNNGFEVGKEELSKTKLKDPITQVVRVGTKPPPPLQGTGTFIYPVNGARLTSRYTSYHQAIDLAIATGTKIRASDGGTVIYSGYSGSYGYVVRINHGGNRVTLYAHCSKLLVKAGDKVYQGQHIANIGSTGRSTGPHVHFEIIINGIRKNPLNYI